MEQISSWEVEETHINRTFPKTYRCFHGIVDLTQLNTHLAKQLIVGTGSLEDRKTVARPPDGKPVADIGNVALVAAGPVSFEHVHVVPLPQNVLGFGGVFRNEVDDLLEQIEVVVFLG